MRHRRVLSLSELVLRAVGERSKTIAGTRAPGSGFAVRIGDPGGAEVSVISEGDALGFYIRRHAHADTVTAVSLSPGTILRLCAALVWRWWIQGTWCGLKLRVWNWALGRKITSGIPG